MVEQFAHEGHATWDCPSEAPWDWSAGAVCMMNCWPGCLPCICNAIDCICDGVSWSWAQRKSMATRQWKSNTLTSLQYAIPTLNQFTQSNHSFVNRFKSQHTWSREALAISHHQQHHPINSLHSLTHSCVGDVSYDTTFKPGCAYKRISLKKSVFNATLQFYYRVLTSMAS